MDDYPYWHQLSLADRLWIAALEAEEAGLPGEIVAAIREVAWLGEPMELPFPGSEFLSLRHRHDGSEKGPR